MFGLAEIISASILLLYSCIPCQFRYGYNEAGYNLKLERHFVEQVVPCESKWDRFAVNTSSGAKGLAQFLPSTWIQISERIGYSGDWTNPIDQGYYTSYWTTQTNPAGSGGWIGCW